MENVISRIYKTGIIPVTVIKDVERDTLKICEALLAGGVDVIEITFRAKGAQTAIESIKKHYPQMLVGGGTVRCEEQARACEGSGADFVVTPGFDVAIVEYCKRKRLPIFPGCTTASEYQAAYSHGLDTVKFFPAEQSGGASKIKALSGPYPDIRVIPTGGITLDNVNEYMALPCTLACGGSYMVAQRLIDEGKFDKISEFCRMTLDKIKEVR